MWILPRSFQEGRSTPHHRSWWTREDEYEVEAILGHRDAGRQRKREYLVKWRGYSALHNSWECAENLQNAGDEVDRYLQRLSVTRPRKAKEGPCKGLVNRQIRFCRLIQPCLGCHVAVVGGVRIYCPGKPCACLKRG